MISLNITFQYKETCTKIVQTSDQKLPVWILVDERQHNQPIFSCSALQEESSFLVIMTWFKFVLASDRIISTLFSKSIAMHLLVISLSIRSYCHAAPLFQS